MLYVSIKAFLYKKYIFTSKKKCEKGISVPPLTTVLWTISFYIVADIENIGLVFTFIQFFSLNELNDSILQYWFY